MVYHANCIIYALMYVYIFSYLVNKTRDMVVNIPVCNLKLLGSYFSFYF